MPQGVSASDVAYAFGLTICRLLAYPTPPLVVCLVVVLF